MKLINKKSNTMLFILFGILMGLFGGLIFYGTFSDTNKKVSSEADKLKCLTVLNLVSSKNDSIVSSLKKLTINKFLVEINNKCPKDTLEWESKSETENFKQLASTSLNIYEMYGKGEVDFLSNFGESGEYCFLGATFNPKPELGEYQYSDYTEFLKTEIISKKKYNGTTYFDEIKVKYSGTFGENAKEEKEQLDKDILELQKLDDADFSISVINTLLKENQDNLDIYNKKINLNEKLFVVFVFDRNEKDISDLENQQIIDLFQDAGIELAKDIVIGIAVTGGLKTIWGIAKVPYKIFKGISSVNTLNKITKILKKLGKTKKFSSGAGIKFTKENMEKIFSPKIIKKYFTSNEKQLYGNAAKVKYEKLLNGGKIVPSDKEILISKAGNLGLKLIPFKTLKSGSKFGGGYYIGSNLDNKNYLQYIEIMNQEEYYRKCGFEQQIKIN